MASFRGNWSGLESPTSPHFGGYTGGDDGSRDSARFGATAHVDGGIGINLAGWWMLSWRLLLSLGLGFWLMLWADVVSRLGSMRLDARGYAAAGARRHARCKAWQDTALV
ncbi:hypothetical protein V6N11_034127 [Hibiscus sabdariffa]